MSKKIRLLLVDDHEIVRAGIRMLFLAEEDMEIVGEVGSGREAIESVRELAPDVVIMDVAMPGMSGIEATRQIKEASPDTTVLALTMYDDEQYFFEMLNAGASGYIPKRAAPDDLVSAIRVVNEGNVFLHSTLAKFLMKDVLGQTEVNADADADAQAEQPIPELTPREHEVLTYIAEGFTNREIAEALVISVKTVDRHRENIMQKLNLHNRVELVKYAIERGLISVG
jgi:DNA-binding NarL/FixJ family response regulator